MKRKTFYTTVEVDADCEIDFEDILELIESCDEDELDEIREIVNKDVASIITKNSNLDELQKAELLAAAMKKYTYQELQDRLEIQPYEIF